MSTGNSVKSQGNTSATGTATRLHSHSHSIDIDRHLHQLDLLNQMMICKPGQPQAQPQMPTSATPTRLAPAVPPKPKPKHKKHQSQNQPLVPQSYSIKTVREPSYSVRLLSTDPPPSHNHHQDQQAPPVYCNLNARRAPYRPDINVRSGDALVYCNLLPPGGTNHVYTNVPYPRGPEAEAPPPEEMPPPPSPVSSSYSELRRAADAPYRPTASFPPEYTGYGGSQTSSAYESLYEPINPRPPSQMSSRSEYSVYGGAPQTERREAEVDALTDLLVRSMGNGGREARDGRETESYGACAECGEEVLGESTGCTAMERVYHVKCFVCRRCAINLQGKPFYALDGEPYCEEDYLNTLEKCSVCTEPILDRILRATGKPYHPACFCCVVCGKSLDGIPFTVDATNRIHCIEDFHRKFAPRCCVCTQPIMLEPEQGGTVRIVALDRSFHLSCYKCEDCGLNLYSEEEERGCYPLDDHVLCKSCNAERVQALTSRMTTEL